MMRVLSFTVVAALVPAIVFGAAISYKPGTPLAPGSLDGLAPIASFAAAGYCRPNDTAIWSCGPNCDAVGDFIPTASGGDGISSQFWYAGYHPPLNSVIISHQGTRAKSILPIFTDIDIGLEEPDSTTFPGLAESGVLLHNGFYEAHQLVFADVLEAVKETMTAHNTTSIILTGHSLGAALTVLDAVALQLALPKDTKYKIITFGLPRVGNPAFANYVDATFGGNVIRMTNKKDPVPTLPGLFLGFKHFQGEVHIRSEDSALVVCQGQDSESADCSVGEVPNLLFSDVTAHTGPYFGQIMKCFDEAGTQIRSLSDDEGNIQ